MSSSLDNLELCRLCLVKDRVSVPIFEDEGDVRQIFLKITACLPVKVSREDKLPKKICDDCVYKVELFYQFWNTTANAEKQLLQWLDEVGGLEDKQGYITNVLDSNVMKQERNSDNRLDGNVMQVSGHQNNMDIGMIENMTIMTMPAGDDQQFTAVPMDASGTVQTVQAVPGPSNQTPHDQMAQSQSHLVEEEEEDMEDDNSDDGCDNEEGLPVKEETEDQSDQPLEPTAFVNVPLPCDEAGPSGLQQQKISEISEMSMQQTAADGDPKTGSSDGSSGDSTEKPSLTSGRGIFIFERESVVMRKWQILEFDGKPYYAFVPDEEEVPLDINELPEYGDDVGFEVTGTDEEAEQAKENPDVDIRVKVEQRAQARTVDASIDENSMDDQEGCFDYQELEEEEEEKEEEAQPEPADVKPVIVNGKATALQQAGLEAKPEATDVKPPIGDLYQVKVQAGMVLLEKLDLAPIGAGQPLIQASGIQVSEVAIEESGAKEHLQEVDEEGELREEAVAQEENPVARGALKCKVCSETFESSVAFKKHVAWTHKRKLYVQENGVYICSVCDYRTQKKSLFAAHLQNKHETWSQRRRSSSPVSFPCAACGFVCRSKHSLQSHFIRKHTDRYEHQCKFCTKKFKVKGDLTNHIRFHHKEKPVNCDVCGKLCMNSGSLYVHQKWAHYKPKYECPICKRRMVTQENLDQHMLMQHEKREKIVCAECGKTFSKKDSFKRHMAVHTGQKPYKCLICHKSFARRSQLRQHLLIHTGKRPFVCDICGKAFTQKPGLICHRKTHPGSHPPLPVMPIGDIVKEFTDGYLAGTLVAKKEEDDENPEEELEDEYDDEEEDEEYEEGMEEQEVLEEVILDEEMEMDKLD